VIVKRIVWTAIWLAAWSAPARAGVYEDRERDWRNGAIVYQVIVDRFAPSADLEAKRALYPAPKVLRRWDEVPQRNEEIAPGTQITRHELHFWGGDLQSLTARLDHVQTLGANVLYLNPIHLGFTNHKYDSLDFHAVSPEYGTRADVKALAAELHRRGMRLVLDGVFNHMGRHAPAFTRAEPSRGPRPTRRRPHATGSFSARSSRVVRAPGRACSTCPS